MSDKPLHRKRHALNWTPFDLEHLREDCLDTLKQSQHEMDELTPAQRAVVAAYREMPLLAEILAAGINQRYAAYREKGTVSGRADMDLLMAIFGRQEAYNLTLKFDVSTPEGLAIFEHPDFAGAIETLPAVVKEQVRDHQRRWQEERTQRREVLGAGPVEAPAGA
jgi:hypothetical protein